MQNLLNIEEFLFESIEPEFRFTQEQINESLEYLNSDDPLVLEAWYNTVLDFAALIPVVGSIAEGINLVSYAKQGETLLAALCAIGLIPIFGQYIGAGGTLLIKILGKGGKLGGKILKPLVNLVAKFFPKITAFFKSPKFAAKFSGIGPYIDKMLISLKNFVKTGGAKIAEIAKTPSKVRSLKTGVVKTKQVYKIGDWLLGGKAKAAEQEGQAAQIPVPKDAYLSYQGTPLSNIRPYTDMEISQAETAQNWDQYL